MEPKKAILIIVLFIVVIGGGYFTLMSLNVFQQREARVLMKPITLNYWRVYDGNDTFAPLIANFNQVHPYIKINYKKLRYDEYEQALIEAFAVDKGPDIFSVHNTWLGKYKSKGLIVPSPLEMKVAVPVEVGTVQKQIIPEARIIKGLTYRDIENKFVDAVYKDVVFTDRNKKGEITKSVYGLPLYIDTLAMYYNKDLFNNAGITTPSLYWNRKFQQDVKKLTKQDVKGNIIQSGAALGGSDNIERFSDILSTLMMQNGTQMMTPGGAVSFNSVPENTKDKNYNPGLEALRFYTDFANPGKEVYSWNDSLDNSVNLFADGKLAMLFAYSYHLPIIKAKNPKLNFNISKLPQIEGNDEKVNFANYWVEVVSNKTKNIDAAWRFVQFITEEKQAKLYFEKTQKPTALRSLVTEQVENFDVGIFAEQVLTARSWYKGNNAIAAENYFGDLIEQVNSGQRELVDAIEQTSKKIQQTVNQ